jgi:serine/threonine protein phosphatase 1
MEKVDLNKMRRIFAIGDIHGCYNKMLTIMEQIPFEAERDQLVFLGDYIDRGVHSRQVLDYLVQLKKKLPQTVFLLGNHEQMLLDFLGGEDMKPFLMNGGQKTLDSYQVNKEALGHRDPRTFFPSEHLGFFNSLSHTFEDQDYFFVHAGLRGGIPIKEQDLTDLLWIREDFYFSNFDFGKTIVFGHTPFPEPFIYNKRIGIDTGAVYGNKLTALELPAMKFYSV